MKHKLVSFDEIKNFIADEDFTFSATNSVEIKRTIRLMNTAIKTELTNRQRKCLELYYFQGYTQTEIGAMLGITGATVCRHIKKAQKAIRRLMRYSGLGSENLDKQRK